MSVIRVKHNKENPYVIINKRVLEDPNLSFKAKGLWAYCMSRPDDWEFRMSHLVKVSSEGKAAVTKAIHELIEHGYCVRIQNKDEVGRWTTVDYEIFEHAELKKCLPLSDFRLAENRPLLSNDSNQSFLEEKKEAPPLLKKKSPKKEKKRFLEKVLLTQEEHTKLAMDLGQAATDRWIEALNDYILSKGDKYQSHYQTILNWIKRDGPRAAPGAVRPNEQVIAKRKSMAAQCDMGKVNGFDVSASKEYVEFSRGSFSRQVRYDASKEAWEETTGWKD